MKTKTLLAVLAASLLLNACKGEPTLSPSPSETTGETSVETVTTTQTETVSITTETEPLEPSEKDFYDLSDEEFDTLSDEELLERFENAERDEDDEMYERDYGSWTRIPEPWEERGDCLPGHSWSYDAIDASLSIYVGEENEKAWLESLDGPFDMGMFIEHFNITKRDFLRLCKERPRLKYMYNINELYPPNENDQGEDNNDQGGNQNDQGNSKSTAAPKDTNATTTKKPSNQNQQ
jgi:hypothetical protein